MKIFFDIFEKKLKKINTGVTQNFLMQKSCKISNLHADFFFKSAKYYNPGKLRNLQLEKFKPVAKNFTIKSGGSFEEDQFTGSDQIPID